MISADLLTHTNLSRRERMMLKRRGLICERRGCWKVKVNSYSCHDHRRTRKGAKCKGTLTFVPLAGRAQRTAICKHCGRELRVQWPEKIWTGKFRGRLPWHMTPAQLAARKLRKAA